MNRALVALAVCASLAPGVSQAQALPAWEPTLVITINVGMASGGDLWSLPPQPQDVLGSTQFDTLHLARVLRPGLVAGLGVTYFFSPKLGLSGEATYFGIASEQRCQGPATYAVDSLNAGVNEQACTTANGSHVNTSIVGFLFGLTFRGSATARIQPFVRASMGPGLIGNSYVKTTGTVFIGSSACAAGCSFTLLGDDAPAQFSFVANLVAGASIYLSPAYRLRFEVRDVIASLPVATSIHPPTSSSGTQGREMRHIPVFTFGMDLSLEQRRERRY